MTGTPVQRPPTVSPVWPVLPTPSSLGSSLLSREVRAQPAAQAVASQAACWSVRPSNCCLGIPHHFWFRFLWLKSKSREDQNPEIHLLLGNVAPCQPFTSSVLHSGTHPCSHRCFVTGCSYKNKPHQKYGKESKLVGRGRKDKQGKMLQKIFLLLGVVHTLAMEWKDLKVNSSNLRSEF